MFKDFDKVSNSYTCGICKQILNHPKNIGCSGNHEFCRNCINEYVKTDGQKCPECGNMIASLDQMIENEDKTLEIYELEVKCMIPGCIYESTLFQWQKHQQTMHIQNNHVKGPAIMPPNVNKNTIIVKIKDMNNRIKSIPISKFETVKTLKVYIEEKEGIPTDRQKLAYHGEILQNDKKINDLGLHEASVLNLLSKFKGGFGRFN